MYNAIEQVTMKGSELPLSLRSTVHRNAATFDKDSASDPTNSLSGISLQHFTIRHQTNSRLHNEAQHTEQAPGCRCNRQCSAKQTKVLATEGAQQTQYQDSIKQFHSVLPRPDHLRRVLPVVRCVLHCLEDERRAEQAVQQRAAMTLVQWAHQVDG